METKQTTAAGNGQATRTTRGQLRKVTDGTTSETLGDALTLLANEAQEISNVLHLADRTLDNAEGFYDKSALQAAIANQRDRLGVIVEELERLAGQVEAKERVA